MHSCVCMDMKKIIVVLHTPESDLQKFVRQDTECLNTFQLKLSLMNTY